MLAGVHAQSAGSAAEAVALGSELAGVAHLAVQLVLMLVGVGRVEELVAQACREITNAIIHNGSKLVTTET